MPFHFHDFLWPDHHHHQDCHHHDHNGVGHEHGHASLLTTVDALPLPHRGRGRSLGSAFLSPHEGPATVGSTSHGLAASARTSTASAEAASFLHIPQHKASMNFHDSRQATLMQDASSMAGFVGMGRARRNGLAASAASSFLSVKGLLPPALQGKSFMEIVQLAPPSALVPLHAASIVTSLPGHIVFELGEGYLFGFKKGLALAFAGKSLGALASFGIGRSALVCCGLKDGLQKQMEAWPIAKNVAVAVEQGGVLAVFLIRIAPVPCVVKNYSLALLTETPWSTYVPATLLGLLPTTAAHVYAGTLATSAYELTAGHGAAMRVVGLTSTIAAAGLISMLAGYYLRSMTAVPEEDCDEDAEDTGLGHQAVKLQKS